MLRRFQRDESGVVALLFGLILIPILGISGMALDYGRASSATTKLQSALDATALAVARATGEMDDDEAAAFAREYFAANFSANLDYDYTIEGLEREDGKVVLLASGQVPTTLMRIAGFDNMPVATSSEVSWSIGRLEIALVLDNTGSMSRQNRMGALKDASQVLLDLLERQADGPESVKISLVPFDEHVKLDPSFAGASWLDLDDGSSGNGNSGGRPGNSGNAPGNSRGSGSGGGTSWEGCIEDRNPPHDVTADPATSSQMLYPAADCGSNSTLAPIQPLTSNFNTLRSRINAMQPNGWTNITIGMVWGLNTLLDHAPFTEASPSGTEEVTKIMILMTDGENTKNRWHHTRNSGSNAAQAINQRTKRACDSVKDEGVMLYTVRFMEGDQNLMRDCATRPEMYYDVNAVGQLRSAFEGIASQISQLRLSR